MADVFGSTALVAAGGKLVEGGNFVLVGWDGALDPEQVRRLAGERVADAEVLVGARLDRLADPGMLLTDDHAPVDQLLTPYTL
jgi:hypothetical protein